MSELVLPRGFGQSVDLAAPRHQVFDYLDDFERIGEHMMRSNRMMAGARLNVFIDYAIPPSGIGHLLGRLFAGAYARWCVRSTLASAASHFGIAPTSTDAAMNLLSPTTRSATK